MNRRGRGAAAAAGLLGVVAGWATSGGPSDVRAGGAACDRPGDPTVACVHWMAPDSREAVSGVLSGDACRIDVVYGSIRIVDIRFSVSGRSLNTRTQKPYACDWNTRGVANGGYTLKATVRFENGEVREDEVQVDVRNPDPTTSTTTTVTVERDRTTTIVNPSPPVITRIASTVSTQWLAYRRHTVVRRLGVEGVPAGAAVSVLCRGQGCDFRSRRILVRRARDVRLSRYFSRDRLRPGTQIDIRITKRGAVGKLVRYTMLRNKRLPRRSVACLSAGSGRRIGCR